MSPRPPLMFRIGTLVPVLAVAITGFALTLAALASYGVFPERARLLAAPTATELEATLLRVGLSAETLAAAGCSDADATNAGGDAKTYLDATRWAALQTADEDVRAAQADVERLGRLVRAGQASQDDLNAYSTAQTALSSAEDARDGLLDSLFDAAVADLEPAEITRIEALHSNATRPVDLQYRVSDRTDQAWTDLRDALANLKTSGMSGEDPDAGCAQLVSSADAEPAVSTAKTNLDTNLGTVSTAYAAALGHE